MARVGSPKFNKNILVLGGPPAERAVERPVKRGGCGGGTVDGTVEGAV